MLPFESSANLPIRLEGRSFEEIIQVALAHRVHYEQKRSAKKLFVTEKEASELALHKFSLSS